MEARGAFPYYYYAARYSEQLTRYLERFPAAQLHVIVFDDFKRDVGAVYAGVLTFLGLSRLRRTSSTSTATNASTAARSTPFCRTRVRPSTGCRNPSVRLPIKHWTDSTQRSKRGRRSSPPSKSSSNVILPRKWSI